MYIQFSEKEKDFSPTFSILYTTYIEKAKFFFPFADPMNVTYKIAGEKMRFAKWSRRVKCTKNSREQYAPP